MGSKTTAVRTAAPARNMWAEAARLAEDDGKRMRRNDKLVTRRVDKLVRDARANRISPEELGRRLTAASHLPGFMHALAALDLHAKSH